MEKNEYDLNNHILFPLPEQGNGKNRYDYPDPSTKDSYINTDIGPGDYLDDSEECSNTESNNESEDGILSRKSLHAFKCQYSVIESDFAILALLCCVMREVRK